MALNLTSANLALQDMISSGNLSVSGLFELASQVDAQVRNVAPGSTFLLYSGGRDAAAISSNLASTAPDVYDLASTAAGDFLDSEAFGNALKDAVANEQFNMAYDDLTLAEQESVKTSVDLDLYGVDATGARVSSTSLFDIVSHSYVMENDGNWRIVAVGDVDPNSVAMQTELPALLSKPGDFLINGESRTVLAQSGSLTEQVDMAIAQSAAISEASLVSSGSSAEFLSMTIQQALGVLVAPESAALLGDATATLNRLGAAGMLLSAALVAQQANAAYANGDIAKGNALIGGWATGLAGGLAGAELAVAASTSALAPLYLTGPAGALIAGGLSLLAGLVGGIAGSAVGSTAYGSLLGILENLFQAATQPISPLELDLTGGGVQTVGQQAGVYFDYRGNGFAEATGWSAPQDGLLVLPDANGLVTNGSELFGNYSVLPDGSLAPNGFVALKAFDSNGDGVIDASDPIFSQLRLWVGGNGQPGSGQLVTLTEAGIQSLNLNYATQSYTDANGNQFRQVGSFTLTDGTTRAMVDVWYGVDTGRTVDMSAPVAVSADIAALPDLAGFGNVHSLQQAMARDTSGRLEGLVQAFVANANTMTAAQARSAAESILLDWSGADQYSSTSRGPNIDAREVYTLEAFMGQAYAQGGNANPEPIAAGVLNQAYGQLLDWLTGQLLAQTKFAPWLNEVSMTWDTATGTLGFDVSAVVATLGSVYGNDPVQGAEWMRVFGQSLKAMGDTGMQILSAIRQQGSLDGTGFNLALAALGDVVLQVSRANQSLTAAAGTDTVFVTTPGGNASFSGSSGEDLYVLHTGSGQTTITTAGGHDTVCFTDVASTAVTSVTRNGNSLVVRYGGGDQVTVTNYFLQTALGGQPTSNNSAALAFNDGVTWSLADVAQRQQLVDGYQSITGVSGVSNTIHAGAGSQSIYAGNAGDTLIAGSGSDTFYGGAGDDTFVVHSGNGQVMVVSTGGGHDTLRFADVASTAVSSVGRNGSDLVVRYGSGDQVTVSGYFTQTGTVNGQAVYGNTVSISFADGVNWGLADVAQRQQLADGSQNVNGVSGTANTIQAGSGTQTLHAGNAGDTLIAGSGRGMFYGGAGDDTFVVHTGSGQVTVVSTGGGYDTLRCADVASTAVTSVGRNGSDLVMQYGSGDTVTVTNYFLQTATVNGQAVYGYTVPISFADGVTWSLAEVAQRQQLADGYQSITGVQGVSNTIQAGVGSQTIYAGNAGDTLIAGSGSDKLYGGAGNDTFVIHAGAGQTTILDSHNPATGTDTLLFSNLDQTNLWFSHVGNDLQIDVLGSSERVTVTNWYASGSGGTSNQVDRVQTADGLGMTCFDVNQLVQAMASFDPPASGVTSWTSGQTSPTGQVLLTVNHASS